MKINKRSKLITTIGPASENIIKDLFKAGMTTVRLNFSHGDHEEQGARIKTTKELRKELNVPISILLDTKGPEIRVGKFVNKMQHFKRDQKVTIYTDSESYKNKECSTGEMTVAYDMSKDLSVGKSILVDDGKLELTVVDIKPGLIHAISKNEHIVKTNKRVNLPGTKFSMPFLAEKDIIDIKYAADNELDYIAASFVNTPEDIMQIKDILKEKNAEDIQIIAKIESQYAVDNFDDILEVTDAVMIARGDLGLEIPYYEVPVAEKMMIRKCREAGKPVIVATQMLDSMETNPHPTRAEVTDVYLATELGSDATMLSGESAAGDYPVKAVEVMSTINHRAEDEFYNKTYYNKYIEGLKDPSTKRGKIAKSVTLKAHKGEYKFAVVLSRTGQLLKEVAKYRPDTNILGLVSDKRQVTKFGIVHSVFVETDVTLFDEVKKNKEAAHKIVEHYGGLKGDKFLVVENDKISEFTL